ncbi:hypothetical protein SAMN04487911_13120 [Arenibacter nanhaiticus]|uniref:Uncharacterized protein n=1 Tax=Arenibacter nanhaiticus TaxID=558155 RepID=A0A1M6LFR0_9FLAO|nr:hypothetical protein [Arenibacter nanhaiticus]SHJ69986.1 hypothetical protein SAMN04487911_13120 [Arenibacter nanhaiticus]
MATYKCVSCGLTRNDSLISKFTTPPMCVISHPTAAMTSHSWAKIANEDYY